MPESTSAAFEPGGILQALCQGRTALSELSREQTESLALWVLTRNIADGTLDAVHVLEEEVHMLRAVEQTLD